MIKRKGDMCETHKDCEAELGRTPPPYGRHRVSRGGRDGPLSAA